MLTLFTYSRSQHMAKSRFGIEYRQMGVPVLTHGTAREMAKTFGDSIAIVAAAAVAKFQTLPLQQQLAAIVGVRSQLAGIPKEQHANDNPRSEDRADESDGETD